MSIIGSNILAGASGSGVSAYEIEQSLRFDGSSYLNRTPGSAGNRRTSTLSFWFKWVSSGGEGVFLWANGRTKLAIDPGGFDALSLDDYDGSYNLRKLTAQSLRDPSAWYHLVVVMDTTNATAGDRQRLYLNGQRITAFSTSTDSGQNFDTDWNNNVEHRIGADNNPFYFRGYIAEMHMLDGTAVTDAEDFGEFDDNGVWRPIRYTGSYGTNGFYLKFDPSATNGIGHDHSGNGNNWTPTGFSTTAGTGYDVMDDTPTTNYATLNPLRMNGTVALSASLADGNLYFKSSSQYKTAIASIGMSTGKWYFEAETANAGGTGDANLVGIEIEGNPGANHFISSDPNGVTTGYGYLNVNGNLRGGTAAADDQTGGATWTAGDIIGVTYDADAGQAKWYKNNTLVYTKSGLSGTWFFAVSGYDSSQSNSHFYVNFGQRAFAYTPPTGFKALNTSNLPAPDIADGSTAMDVVTWTGDGTTPRSITGLNFSPDFVWTRNRTTAYWHNLYDIIRGTRTPLHSNTTNGDDTANDGLYGGLSSFDSNGFTLADGTATGSTNIWTNRSGDGFVAWAWDAGGSGSSNTDGSIPSTVSANPSAGFSIVSYTGTGTAGATVGHGLGVAPSMIIIKNRDDYTSSFWCVYHKSVYVSASDPNVLYLNSTQGQTDDTNVWGPSPDFSSTIFELGDYNGSNGSGDALIAYCFAEVEGYSKFGSYTGNGSTDGPFVFCGFKPQWIMYKQSSSSGNWYIYDAERSPANGGSLDKYLIANSAAAEDSDGASNTTEDVDLLSNGFKIRDSGGAVNTSGATYIFVCFASNPFGGSGVSPATAR